MRRIVVLWWLLVCYAAAAASAVVYSNGGWPPIRSDGFGYYAYLPSVFVDGDLDMRTPLASQATVIGNGPSNPAWTGIRPWCDDPGATAFAGDRHCKGPVLNKYPPGTAIMQLPFFIVAHGLTKLADPALATGYSTFYQIGNIVSATFFAGLGALLTLIVLLRYNEEFVALIAAVLAIFGTSVFDYASVDGCYSHIYSFAAVAALLLLTLDYRAAPALRPAWGRALSVGGTLGLVALVRNPNVIVGLLPLAIVVERSLGRRNLRAVVAEALAIGVAFAGMFLIQALYWHARTGHWLVNSYLHDDPGFNWLSPHLWDFTFGVRKGLFLWAPCLLAAVLGIPLFVRRDRMPGLAIAAILLGQIYVCASWSAWWFGAGYGSRPFVDVMPLAALPLAAGVGWIAPHLGRIAVVGGTLALVSLSLFLTMSYWTGQLPPDGATIGDLLSLPSKWLSPG